MFHLRQVNRNYYKRLGVGFRASPSEIKVAFRELAKKLHPDQNPNNPEAEKKFRDVKEAYECLSNKLKRSQYDREWIESGKPMYNPGTARSTAESPDDDPATLTRLQLVSVYAIVFILPLLVSVTRRSEEPHEVTSSNRSAWVAAPGLPDISPRDVLVRAFYNPISGRWERLENSVEPPTPLELFQFVVRERPGLYTKLIQSV